MGAGRSYQTPRGMRVRLTDGREGRSGTLEVPDVPYVRCPACKLRFHAATSHSALVRCPECETVLSASRPADVNAWLARQIVAEMPAASRARVLGNESTGSTGADA